MCKARPTCHINQKHQRKKSVTYLEHHGQRQTEALSAKKRLRQRIWMERCTYTESLDLSRLLSAEPRVGLYKYKISTCTQSRDASHLHLQSHWSHGNRSKHILYHGHHHCQRTDCIHQTHLGSSSVAELSSSVENSSRAFTDGRSSRCFFKLCNVRLRT